MVAWVVTIALCFLFSVAGQPQDASAAGDVAGVAREDWVSQQLDAFAVPEEYRSGWTELVGASPADASTNSHAAVEFVQRTRQNADAGRHAAQFLFGVMAHFGDGIPQNAAVAADYLRRAAAGGNARAQAALGIVLARGEGAGGATSATSVGVARNVQGAMRWLRLAAISGEVEAQFCLGKMTQIGLNATATGFGDALQWYARAAGKGHLEGTFELAVAFEYGRGLQGLAKPEQLANARWRMQQAALLYERAAAQGHVEARYHLALMYFYGRYDETMKELGDGASPSGGGLARGGDGEGASGGSEVGDDSGGAATAAAAAGEGGRLTPFGVNAMAEPEHQYRKAAALFKEGAETGHGPSEYILPLHFTRIMLTI